MKIVFCISLLVAAIHPTLSQEVISINGMTFNGDVERKLGKAKKGKKAHKGGKAKKAKGESNMAFDAMSSVPMSSLADTVTLGPRPYYLVDSMKPSFLKDDLTECANEMTSFQKSDFSIGHRGACMMYPEHTIRSYKAASLMGANILECDVTFTKDRELICRHAQCDLHTTTDVVLRPEMNAKCTVPWAEGVSPRCCASDFTLEEIKTLCAKMDSSVGDATTAEGYVYGGTADWRTDIYQYECPPVPTHMEHIEMTLVRTDSWNVTKITQNI